MNLQKAIQALFDRSQKSLARKTESQAPSQLLHLDHPIKSWLDTHSSCMKRPLGQGLWLEAMDALLAAPQCEYPLEIATNSA
jgi:hypothetical protein